MRLWRARDGSHRHPADRVDGERRRRPGRRAPATATERVSPAPAARPSRRTATILRQDRERDLGRRARTDVETRGHVDARELLLEHAVAAQLGEHSGAALRTGDEADVGQAGLEAPAERVQLVAAVCGDDEREISRPRLEGVALHAHGIQTELGADQQDGLGSRRRADHEHARRGQYRLEEHLDHASRQAWILDDDGAVLGGEVMARAPLAVLGERQDPQQYRLAVLQRLQRVGAHAVLGADAADEALDRSVGEHERDVSRLHARRPLHVHHRRGHERRALGAELLGPPR